MYETPRVLRLVSTAVFLSVGLYALYVVREHSGYVRQLRDSPGNRKIKRREKSLFVMGLIFLLAAAWRLWLFITSR